MCSCRCRCRCQTVRRGVRHWTPWPDCAAAAQVLPHTRVVDWTDSAAARVFLGALTGGLAASEGAPLSLRLECAPAAKAREEAARRIQATARGNATRRVRRAGAGRRGGGSPAASLRRRRAGQMRLNIYSQVAVKMQRIFRGRTARAFVRKLREEAELAARIQMPTIGGICAHTAAAPHPFLQRARCLRLMAIARARSPGAEHFDRGERRLHPREYFQADARTVHRGGVRPRDQHRVSGARRGGGLAHGRCGLWDACTRGARHRRRSVPRASRALTSTLCAPRGPTRCGTSCGGRSGGSRHGASAANGCFTRRARRSSRARSCRASRSRCSTRGARGRRGRASSCCGRSSRTARCTR